MNPDLYILWAGAIATLGVYTILYRENPVSRLFEHIFVGLSAGYLIVATWAQNLEGKWWAPMVADGRWYWIFAPVIGLLFYFIYSRRFSWLARLVMGLFFGAAAGTFFRQFFPIYSPQVAACFKSLSPAIAAPAALLFWRGAVAWLLVAGILYLTGIPRLVWPARIALIVAGAAGAYAVLFATGAGAQDWGAWGEVLLHHWLFVIILLTVLSYFFFSVPHEGGFGRNLGRLSIAGRWFLMIAFGAMFGNTVMARVSLFIGRMYFLLHDWLGSVIPWFARSGA